MTFSDPQKNIDQLGIAEGMRVADLGAGSGFYSIVSARKVSEEGVVYAVDINKDLLSRVQQEAAAEELQNVEVVWGDITAPRGTQISDGAIDVVIISNVLFQVDDIAPVVTEAHRILHAGGRVLVVDWTDSFGGLGPHPDAIVPEHRVREVLEQEGFTVEKGIDAGQHHYGIVARKPK